MNEKIYKTMSFTGAWDIAIGVVVMIVGISAGILAVINGARLLAARKNILF